MVKKAIETAVHVHIKLGIHVILMVFPGGACVLYTYIFKKRPLKVECMIHLKLK